MQSVPLVTLFLGENPCSEMYLSAEYDKTAGLVYQI